jgi:hypothetical protein
MSDANAFDYIAFNQISGEILSHGATAAQAALLAEVKTQTSVLMIVKAGRVGIDVWEAKLPYPQAAEALWLPVFDSKIHTQPT